MNEPIEYLPSEDEATPEPEPTTALAVIPASPNPLAARDAGIASYLSSAYSKAGTLRLTPEETKILKADFPDDAFLTGAAGRADLIYINPRNLRDRMDEGLGLGGWSLVALRTWKEDFKDSKGNSEVRVYHECILIVRGVYICQAVGDMSYNPGNRIMNYGDCYQGSQSHSLRRCLKDFGVGLQAWSKTFQLGWFQRQSQRLRGVESPPPSANPPPAPAAAPSEPSAPKANAKKAPRTMADSNMRARLLEVLGCQEDGPEKDLLKKFLVALGWLPTDKEVEQLHYRFVPLTKEEMELFKLLFGTFKLNLDTAGYIATAPYAPHGLDPSTLEAHPVAPPALSISSPSNEKPKMDMPAAKPEWTKFIMPFGKKGTALGALTEAELKWYIENFTVKEGREDAKGINQPYPAAIVEQQKALRAALDQAKQQKKG